VGCLVAGSIRSYRDLQVWRLAIRFTKSVYRVTAGFPSDERFGLVSQVRRASVSVASNIAEGWGRGTSQDYVRFLRMARGSVYEVETQLEIASQLEFLDEESYREVIAEVNEAGRVLAGLLRSLEQRESRSPDR